MKSKCILGTGTTLTAAVLWLVPPACGVAWLYGIVGPDARLLYLTAVTLFPAALTLAAPWLRAWLEARSTQRGGEVIKRLAHKQSGQQCGTFNITGGVIKFAAGATLPPEADGRRQWPIAAAKR